MFYCGNLWGVPNVFFSLFLFKIPDDVSGVAKLPHGKRHGTMPFGSLSACEQIAGD